jgi:hypothetical protein
MAHNKTNIDYMQGLTKWWHGLNQIVEKITLSTSPLAKDAPNGWDVEKLPMRDPDGSESEFCRIVCTDDKSIKIGKPVHCETYGLIDNAQFLRVIQDAIDHVPGARVESVGSVCGRTKTFVGVSIPQIAETNGGGRKILNYLNFVNGFDGLPFYAMANSHFIVCDNTLQQAIQDSSGKTLRLKIKHTRNAPQTIENLPALIDAYCGTQRRFAAIMDSLAEKEVSTKQADRFFAGFLAVKETSEANRILVNRAEVEISTRAENQRNRLVDLFLGGKGNNGRDRSDLFGSVTDYYSHESSGGSDAWKQVASSEFGSGQVQKDRAFGLLQNDENFAQTVALGDYLLASN